MDDLMTAWAEAVRAQFTAAEVNTRRAWNEAARAWGTLYLKAKGCPKDQQVYQRLFHEARTRRDEAPRSAEPTLDL